MVTRNENPRISESQASRAPWSVLMLLVACMLATGCGARQPHDQPLAPFQAEAHYQLSIAGEVFGTVFVARDTLRREGALLRRWRCQAEMLLDDEDDRPDLWLTETAELDRDGVVSYCMTSRGPAGDEQLTLVRRGQGWTMISTDARRGTEEFELGRRDLAAVCLLWPLALSEPDGGFRCSDTVKMLDMERGEIVGVDLEVTPAGAAVASPEALREQAVTVAHPSLHRQGACSTDGWGPLPSRLRVGLGDKAYHMTRQDIRGDS